MLSWLFAPLYLTTPTTTSVSSTLCWWLDYLQLFHTPCHAAMLVSLLSAYIVLSYMEELFEGAITMPVWLMNLSIFHLYGNPVFLGVNWTNFLGMTGVAIVLLVMSLVQFRYADIGLG